MPHPSGVLILIYSMVGFVNSVFSPITYPSPMTMSLGGLGGFITLLPITSASLVAFQLYSDLRVYCFTLWFNLIQVYFQFLLLLFIFVFLCFSSKLLFYYQAERPKFYMKSKHINHQNIYMRNQWRKNWVIINNYNIQNR